LVSQFNAINARFSNDEGEFWRIAQYYNDARRLRLRDYYHHTSKAAQLPWDGKVWKYTSTLGVEYGADGRPREDRPILFARFSRNDGTYMCRVPLALPALLEVSAVNAELELISLIAGMAKTEERDRLFDAVSKEPLHRIYDGQLAEYSAAAHCLAKVQGLKEVYRAYSLASAISTLCLNLPDELFDLIKVPSELRDTKGRMEQLVRSRNRGAAFLLISWHGNRNAHKDNRQETVSWVHDAVTAAGLPGLEDIRGRTLAGMESLWGSVIEGPEKTRVDSLLEVGRHNFKCRGLLGTDESLQSMISENSRAILPPVVLGDYQVLCFPGKKAEEPDELQHWLSRAIGGGYEKVLKEFVNACCY
jgi:hypothetical protein